MKLSEDTKRRAQELVDSLGLRKRAVALVARAIHNAVFAERKACADYLDDNDCGCNCAKTGGDLLAGRKATP